MLSSSDKMESIIIIIWSSNSNNIQYDMTEDLSFKIDKCEFMFEWSLQTIIIQLAKLL